MPRYLFLSGIQLKGRLLNTCQLTESDNLVLFERFQREDYYAQKKQKRIGAYDGG